MATTTIFSTPDLLAHICSHLSTVRQLAAMCGVNRATGAYLLGSAQHWVDAARLVCGEAYHSQDGGRRAAMVQMCPWLSVRRSVDVRYRSSSVRDVFSCSRGTCDVLVEEDSGRMVVTSFRIGCDGDFTREVDSSESNYLISAIEDQHRLKAKDLRGFLLRSWNPWFFIHRCHHSIQAIFRVHDSLFAALTLDSVLFVSPKQRRILHTLPNVRVQWKRGAECVFFGSGEIWIVNENGVLLCWA